MSNEVIIIGAGPIGLIHAWIIKTLNSKLNVIVFEKYEEYQRNHTLSVSYNDLEELMKVTKTTEVEDFKKLLKKLKKNGNIRTNDLEKAFKNYALSINVDFKYEAITSENIKEKILDPYFEAALIIGADGTHSTISQTLFSTEKNKDTNQVKYPLDFILQLRFEIEGNSKGCDLSTEQAAIFLRMGRAGKLATETIGSYDEKTEKRPVSLPIFITEDEYNQLKQFTSKKPYHPYKEGNKEQSILPEKLKSFIDEYLKLTNEKLVNNENKLTIDSNSIRISVNETPATHAKKIVTIKNGIPVLITGDARLGTSYRTGLNGGVISTTEWIKRTKKHIQSGFKNKKAFNEALLDFEGWFLNEFVPRRLKWVFNYSAFLINPSIKSFKASSSVKEMSLTNDDYDKGPLLEDYFEYKPDTKEPGQSWRYFPHRSFEPISIAQWAYVPPSYSLYRIWKLITDFFKPYQSAQDYLLDVVQPIKGIFHFNVGVLKIIFGLRQLNGFQVLDGLSMLIRGFVEILTTPIAWFIKPLVRGLVTAIVGTHTIEKNTSMVQLAELGREKLIDKEALTDSKKKYELLAVCNDLHRKFTKSFERGQKTDIQMGELAYFKLIRENRSKLRPEHFTSYFSLFRDKTKVRGKNIQNTHEKKDYEVEIELEDIDLGL